MPDMKEVLRSAIWRSEPTDCATQYAEAALSAIAAYGYKIVPVEPTNGMMHDGWMETPVQWNGEFSDLKAVYTAMLEAAP